MKAYIIQSGHFSQAGNFMGFSAKGEKIHIYKKDIIRLFPQVGIIYRCLGRYEKELVKLPFYCLAEEMEFDYMHHNIKKLENAKFTRLTAIEIRDKDYEIKTAAVHNWADSKIKDLLDDIHNLKIDHEVSYNKMAEMCNDLRKENEDLLENAESERERLELLCKQYEETIKNYQHVVNKIKELTSHDLDNLIALA